MAEHTVPYTHTCLMQLFEPAPVLLCTDSSFKQHYYPKNSLDSNTLEFEIEGDNNIYIDPGDIQILITVKIENLEEGRTVEWKSYLESAIKKKVSGKRKKTDGSGGTGGVQPDDTLKKVYFVNNVLHSLFSSCEISLNQVQISNSNGLYAHKAYIETEWCYSEGAKKTFVPTQGYYQAGKVSDLEFHESFMKTLAVQNENSESPHSYTFYGKLAVDYFSCGALLVPGIPMRIRLVKSAPEFHFISSGKGVNVKNFNVKFESAELIVEKKSVMPTEHMRIQTQMTNKNLRYMFHESINKTFIMGPQTTKFVQEDIFNGAPVRRIQIVMNENTKFMGNADTTPYDYRSFGLSRILIRRRNIPIVDYKVGRNLQRVYRDTMEKGFKYTNESYPSISAYDYRNNGHFTMCFDLTPTAEADKTLQFIGLDSSLSLEMDFFAGHNESIEILAMGEVLANVFISSDRRVWKQYG